MGTVGEIGDAVSKLGEGTIITGVVLGGNYSYCKNMLE